MKTTIERLTILTASVLFSTVVRAATPVIQVQWDQGGTPVHLQDYIVDTSGTGTPDFPDVKLLTGRSDWRVWSTDTDNPEGIGDIGVISSPHAANYMVTIASQSGGYGARNVKGIMLDPSSASNYSISERCATEFPVGASQPSRAPKRAVWHRLSSR